MIVRRAFVHVRSALLGLVAVWAVACGGDSEPEASEVFYPPIELRELVAADVGQFDVDWKPEAVVADEELVFRELEDLQPSDGIFRLPADSPLLEGISVGSVVVWPQVGMFEIVGLHPLGEQVGVETEWARLSDVASRAEIVFEHGLHAGERGRVVGVAPAAEELGAQEQHQLGVVQRPLTVSNGPLKITGDGVTYESKNPDTNSKTSFGISGDTIRASFSSTSGNTSVTLGGTMRIPFAAGLISLAPGEDDPSVRLDFEDIQLEIQAKLAVKGAQGTAKVTPPAQMVFPFAIGPMPVYIAVGTHIEIESTIGTADAVLTAEAGFVMSGSVTLGRNPDGSFGAEGTITGFHTDATTATFDTSFTSGIAIRFAAPRVSFGIGRPGMATTGVYATKSVEFISNIAINPFEHDAYCSMLSTNAGTFVGGEISLLGWKVTRESQISHRDGIRQKKGPLCE